MITVGMATYNGASRARNFLASVRRYTNLSDVATVVVDDGSTNGSAQELEALVHAWPSHRSFVPHGHNCGISAAWNSITREVPSSEYIVIANDDVMVPPMWLESILHPLRTSPQVGVVGLSWHAFLLEDVPQLLVDISQVCPRDPITKQPDDSRIRIYEDTHPGRVMAPTGQLFAFRRADYDAVGGFDETYKSFYEESCFGTSMAAKLKKVGVQLNWPFCWHMWAATFAASPELHAQTRMAASRLHYRQKWQVPEGVHEFEYTNPKYLGAIGDVPIEYLRRGGVVARGVLRQDGSYAVVEG